MEDRYNTCPEKGRKIQYFSRTVMMVKIFFSRKRKVVTFFFQSKDLFAPLKEAQGGGEAFRR